MASIRRGEETFSLNPVKNALFRGRVIGVAILIIMGVGALAAAGVGISGYLQIGSLSNLGQVNAIIMMAAGGGGGIVALVVGIAWSVTNCRKEEHQQNVGRVNFVAPTPSGNTNTLGEIYGVDAWSKLGIEVLDEVPDPPKIAWDDTDSLFKQPFLVNYALLYIPQKFRFKNEVENLNLETFVKIMNDAFESFPESIIDQFGSNTAAGWILISKRPTPQSKRANYTTQQKREASYTTERRRVEAMGYQIPYALEIIVLNFMVAALTGEKLYAEESTWCGEMVDDSPIFVGNYGTEGLNVSLSPLQACGVACVWRRFSS